MNIERIEKLADFLRDATADEMIELAEYTAKNGGVHLIEPEITAETTGELDNE